MTKVPVILFVDDDMEDHVFFTEALQKVDDKAECIAVFNGAEALEKLTAMEKKPDYIFLDINMPIMNGLECLSNIKKSEKFKDIPVIIYTTYTSIRDTREATRLGAKTILNKPYSTKELAGFLERLITKRT